MKQALDTIHPDLQAIARTMPQMSITARSLWMLRILTRFLIRPGKMPAGIRVFNQTIPGPGAQTNVRVRIYQTDNPGAQKAPALLWIHGGGYVGGQAQMDDAYVMPFVREAGAVVVSVDYRLAPNHPFPTPLEDCYAAIKWLAAHAGELGADPQRIAIGGASAGGGLAAALAQLAHDRGEVRPVFQLLVYPMLDDHTATRSDIDPDQHLAWNNLSNRFGWQSYLNQAPGLAQAPEHSVPARRKDLAGLPPAWIGVGAIDLFHDEDVAYAQRLKEAGVACDLLVVPGAFHGFDMSAPDASVVKNFRSAQVQALINAFK